MTSDIATIARREIIYNTAETNERRSQLTAARLR